MLLVMVGFWILLIVGVILVVKWLVEQGRPPAGGSAAARESALDILKKRYARGEIDREEFEGKKRDLL
jgi:putative membrane protein